MAWGGGVGRTGRHWRDFRVKMQGALCVEWKVHGAGLGVHDVEYRVLSAHCGYDD